MADVEHDHCWLKIVDFVQHPEVTCEACAEDARQFFTEFFADATRVGQ